MILASVAAVPARAEEARFESGSIERHVDPPGSADAEYIVDSATLRSTASLTSPWLPDPVAVAFNTGRRARSEATGFLGTFTEGFVEGHRYRVTVRIHIPTSGLDAPRVHAHDGPLAHSEDRWDHDSWAGVSLVVSFDTPTGGGGSRYSLACTGDVFAVSPCANPGELEVSTFYEAQWRNGPPRVGIAVELSTLAEMTPYGESASASASVKVEGVEITQVD